MPRLSVWFVRFSLIHLFLGFTLGGLILTNKGIPFAPWIWNLLPAHMEFLLLGWMVQLAMGVAFWILPRFRIGTARGNEKIIWGAFLFLNLGLMVTILQLWFSYALIMGRLFEIVGVFLYITGAWRRIKPHGM